MHLIHQGQNVCLLFVKIYIAGGEPFYMKGVQRFCELLSKHEWNRKHTEIQIQTNGVSNTDSFLKTLEKFERLTFSISIDGWGSVNELIRFPTQHDIFCRDTQQLIDLKPMNISCNITVQALNLPNVDKVVAKVRRKWNGVCDMHKLYSPISILNCPKPMLCMKF